MSVILGPEFADSELGKALSEVLEDFGSFVGELVVGEKLAPSVAAGYDDVGGLGAGLLAHLELHGNDGNSLTPAFIPDPVHELSNKFAGPGGPIDPEGNGGNFGIPDAISKLLSVIGDPVSTATGAFTRREIDFSIPGRERDFVLARVYDSRALRRGILGPGWSLPLFETFLILSPQATGEAASLLVYWADGTQSSFHPDPASTSRWVGVKAEFGKARFDSLDLPGCADTLSLVVRRPDGTRYFFCPPSFNGAIGNSSVSWLLGVSDPYGNALLFRRDEQGKVDEIVDTLGRVITCAYEGRLLTDVVDWTGRTVTYHYEDGRLVQVELPETLYLDDAETLVSGRPYREYAYQVDGSTPDFTLASPLANNIVSVSENGGPPQITLQYFDEENYSYDKVSSYAIEGASTEFLYFDLDGQEDAYGQAPTHLTEMKSPEGWIERFLHDEGLLLRHEILNGVASSGWVVTEGAYSDEDEGLTHGRWISRYSYDEDYRITEILSTTDLLYPGGQRVGVDYDAESVDRFQQGNAVHTRLEDLGDPASSLDTYYTYDPLTARPFQVSDALGRLHTTYFAHHERPYDEVVKDPLVSGWNVLPEAILSAAEPDVRLLYLLPLFGQGDLNADGVLGGSFEPVLLRQPLTVIAGGPGETSEVRPETRLRYNAHGQVVWVEDPVGRVTTSEYLGGRLHRQTTDAHGVAAATRFEHDALGRVSAIVHADGRGALFDYDARDNLVEVRELPAQNVQVGRDLEGIVFTMTPRQPIAQRFFGADGLERGRSAKDADASVPAYAAGSIPTLTDVFTHDAIGNLVRAEHRVFAADGGLTHTGVQSFAYDSRGGLVHYTSARGLQVSYERSSRGSPVGVVWRDASNDVLARVELDHDAFGRLVRETSAAGLATRHGYDGYGRRVTTSLPTGLVLGTVYDDLGRPIAGTESVGGVEVARSEREYDALDRVVLERARRLAVEADGSVSVLDPEWREVRTGWGEGHDEQLWSEARSGAARELTSYGYDTAGRLRSVAFGDPSEVAIELTYDVLDRVRTMQTQRVAPDLPVGAQAHSLATWDLFYDEHGRFAQVVAPDGAVETIRYLASDRPARVTKANQSVVALSHDSDGRLTKRTEQAGSGLPGERTTSWKYDVEGNLVELLDSEGARTEYEHDLLGRPTVKRYHDGSVESFAAYDLDGRLRRYEYASGRALVLDYRSDGLLDRVQATGADAGVTQSFGYDVAGRFVSVVDAVEGRDAVTSRWRGASTGELLSESQDVGALGLRGSLAEYDGLGHLVSLTYPSAMEIGRTYDALGRLRDVLGGGQLLVRYAEPFGLGGFGEATFGLGSARLEQEYDAVARVARREVVGAGGVVLGGTYEYDSSGNLEERVSTGRGDLREELVYDRFSRLVEWLYDGDGSGNAERAVAWTWDDTDALDGYSDSAATGVVDATSNLLHQLESFPPVAIDYGYDADGNEVLRASAGGVLATRWDALGRALESEYVAQGQVHSVRWSHDALGRLVLSSDSGAGTTRYTYFGSEPLESVGPAGSFEYVAGHGDGDLLGRYDGSGAFLYVHSDPFANVLGLHDGNGVVAESYYYEPFGLARDAATGARLEASALGNDRLFAGKLYFPELGLARMDARFLAVEPGVFLGRDPLGERSGPNLYAYGRANPFRWHDRSGRIVQAFSALLDQIGAAQKNHHVPATPGVSGPGLDVDPDLEPLGGGVRAQQLVGFESPSDLFWFWARHLTDHDSFGVAVGHLFEDDKRFIQHGDLEAYAALLERFLTRSGQSGERLEQSKRWARSELSRIVLGHAVVTVAQVTPGEVLSVALQETLDVDPELADRIGLAFNLRGLLKGLGRRVSRTLGAGDPGKIVTSAARGARSLDDLSRAAGALDRNGLTRAGRSLQKHSSRPGSAFSTSATRAGDLNSAGQSFVDDILTTPGATFTNRTTGRFGDVLDVVTPGGRGVRFGSDGSFLHFLEP